MAQNLFEKYGIKEVADVTLFRIERKEETFESQRKIKIASILKSALKKATVYPLVNGRGGETGFEAYVFENADVLTHTNYDCDDTNSDGTSVSKTVNTATVTFYDVINDPVPAGNTEGFTFKSESAITAAEGINNKTEITRLINISGANDNGTPLKAKDIKNATISNVGTTSVSENMTGAGSNGITADYDKDGVGTHEFTYAQQICMLYAKSQDLITKSGTRYQFKDADTLFGQVVFDDNFTVTPNSTEKVVVAGLAGKFSENLYDLEEIDESIKEITGTIEAKAYDITYVDYAELIVEDEMGFYVPGQLGKEYDKANELVTAFDLSNTYSDFAGGNNGKGIDLSILTANRTWGNNSHYSINDAIDALKQELKIIDVSEDSNNSGFTRAFGGYRVQGETPVNDSTYNYNTYQMNGLNLKNKITNVNATSTYALANVLETLTAIDFDERLGQLKVTDSEDHSSNRAIYINPNSGTLANKSAIYLLHNVNTALTLDKAGIFEFSDKKGNRLYYQDRVFAGTEYLALVTIGSVGLVFVVDRHQTKKFTKTAWMINENGYLTDAQAKKAVDNGLIHTVTVSEGNESFDATCTVGAITVRRTKKSVLHYVPVLFLDTLKVSTLEQTSESTSAQGGHCNAKLITWDYGKTITLSIEDALYTPASMAAIWGGEQGDFKNGVKDTSMIDRFEKITAKRSFIIPAGNQNGTPSEGEVSAQAVYYDPKTMEPFQDGTPIAEGETIYKFTRSVAYDGNSIGNTIEISAEGFPGTYKVIGETLVTDKATGKDQRFQFIIPEAKMSAESETITLEAAGDPVVFSFKMDVLRPDNGVMMKFVQFDVVDNDEEGDGSKMIKNTESLNKLDDAEMYKVSDISEDEMMIGATEY